jgi:hypothetical protein
MFLYLETKEVFILPQKMKAVKTERKEEIEENELHLLGLIIT